MSDMRYDVGELRKPVKLPNGFMRLDAVLTRTGVFRYRNADGTERRELRLPEEVFKEDSLQTFAMLPVTDDHPPVALDADNAKSYQRGSVGESVRRDGKFLVGPIMVTDAKLIAAMESGQKRQVSCGYSCDLEWKAGEYQGERYDAVQRNIRGNHVALVAKGRAGPEVRVRLDHADAIMVSTETEETPMVKYRIDGIEYEVSEQAVQALDKLAHNHADALKAVQTSATEAKAAADKANARADAAEAKVKELEKTTGPEAVRARVQARVALERKAAAVLPETKFDEMTDEGIVQAVVAKAVPDLKQDGLSADYLRARFDIAVEEVEKAAKGRAAVGQAVNGSRKPDTKPDEKRVDSKTAYEKFQQEQRDAWKKPLASTTQQ